ncbi:uncharacterized protein LOC141855046 [Brevipalpus obovatus]|uniref:uncharacterized protein LOC141855046 n=1 Tax=Brevipalpus obovatus TaxID=246614 RepID=UPI003D9F4368
MNNSYKHYHHHQQQQQQQQQQLSAMKKSKSKVKSDFVVWTCSDSPEETVNKWKKELNDVFTKVWTQIVHRQLDDNLLRHQISHLLRDLTYLLELSIKYSYKGIVVNGFSAFVHTVIDFFDHLLRTAYIVKVDSAEDLHEILKIFRSFSQIMIFFQGNREQRKSLNNQQGQNQLNNESETERSLQLHLCDSEEMEITFKKMDSLNFELFFRKFFLFWVSSESRPFIWLMWGAISFFYQRFPRFLKLASFKHVGSSFHEIVSSCSNKTPLRAMQAVDGHISKRLWHLISKRPDVKSETFYVPGQGQWIINEQKVGIIRHQPPMSVEHRIRCRYIRNSTHPNPDNVLIIHLHGGGFVLGMADLHEFYTARYVSKLEGIPILCPDYTLEAVYPIAFQDILDSYLWLLSGDSMVKEKLGFVPEKIVLIGDSAGAAFGMSLMNMLQRIHTEDPYFHLIFPSSVVFFYGALMCSAHWAPSRLMSFFDCILPYGLIMTIVGCITGHDGGRLRKARPDNRIKRFYEYTKEEIRSLRYAFFSCIDKDIWYKEDSNKNNTEEIQKVMSTLNNSLYASLLEFDFSKYSNTSLHLMTSNKCVFLDDNIELARLWKGPVQMHVAKNMIHGFLMVPTETKALEYSLDLIKKAVDYATQNHIERL